MMSSGNTRPGPGRRILPRTAVCLLLLFLAHLAADWYMAESRPGFFLHDDGNEYLAGVRSFMENGTFMAGEERYYEAPRSRDIPEAFRPPLMAFLAGLIVVLIRQFGSYPEGVTFGILLMNIASPLLDRFLPQRIYGYQKKEVQA